MSAIVANDFSLLANLDSKSCTDLSNTAVEFITNGYKLTKDMLAPYNTTIQGGENAITALAKLFSERWVIQNWHNASLAHKQEKQEHATNPIISSPFPVPREITTEHYFYDNSLPSHPSPKKLVLQLEKFMNKINSPFSKPRQIGHQVSASTRTWIGGWM